jgi:hypothetical protein
MWIRRAAVGLRDNNTTTNGLFIEKLPEITERIDG